MKLTLVTETFWPEINGVSMTLERLVKGLGEHGCEVIVAAPRRRDRNELTSSIFRFIPVRGLPIPQYPELRFGFPAHRRLKRAWIADPPDVVHVATEGLLGWSALRVAKRLQIPVISSFHTNFHSYGSHYGYGFLGQIILRWLREFHNKTLKTFVPSLDLMQKLSESGFQNLSLMARGVDSQLYGPHRRDQALRDSWGAGKDTPVALYVGRLASEKNLDLTMRAYRLMRKSLPNLKMVLVGDGPERARLEKAFKEVQFTGVREGLDLAACYASADCFLFGSNSETFGNVVTEAMASALPVLAFDYAAPARFIQSGENGILVPFGDEERFLQGAQQMADIQSSWANLGIAARNSILPHSWESIVQCYLDDIRKVLSPDPEFSPENP